MRVVRLCLLGLLAYIVSMLVLFPLSPIIDRIEPQIAPVKLAGVNGKIFKGQIDSVVYEDDLLPLQVSDVNWSLAPAALLKGTGANVSFKGYGGGGQGQVLRKWNGNLAVSDFSFDAVAKEFEPLLPIPGLATFTGNLSGDINDLILENQLLSTFIGKIKWQDASITSAFFSANLGILDIEVDPSGDKQHRAEIRAKGGDIELEGSIDMTQNGDFEADILITPASTASSELLQQLRQFTRPESGGRYRYGQKGNINRLM